ncbi:MAG: FliI/YscN family ATPase [Rhizomicrobium sp.]
MTLHPLRSRLRSLDPVLRTGRVRKIMPTHIEADGPNVPIGALCAIEARSAAGLDSIRAEVIQVDRDSIILSPLEEGVPTFAGALVTACADTSAVPVGAALLGRAVDALARPVDGLGPLHDAAYHPLRGETVSPLERASPAMTLETGLRAIDGLLTVGRGQRIGIFAASGVGKTSLMTQIARQAKADATVLCLVGERGREVEAIWSHSLSASVRARSVLVAATSDQSAAMRVRAAHYALALAEHWRGEGKHVLFVLDSVTRLAMAMREIGLAAGEPPTVRAYTPNVFAAIPKLVERCGAVRAGGAITAVMTVLSENDEVDDPICELMKSLLDGHIILSRSLAERGHYPAIDCARSISRQAGGLVPDAQRRQAAQVLEWLSVHEAARTLIETGLYAKGSNAGIDRAVERQPEILRFLRQDGGERIDLATTAAGLSLLTGGAA